MPLSKELLEKHVSDVFIETGTHRGQGVMVALACGFDGIFSCDTDVNMLARTPIDIFSNGTVHVGIGESAVWLPMFIELAIGKYQHPDVTFWLDAHRDGNLALHDCPLGDELDIINEYEFMFGIITILIDDMRLFSQDDQDAIERFVQDMREGCKVSRADGHAKDDILVGVM